MPRADRSMNHDLSRDSRLEVFLGGPRVRKVSDWEMRRGICEAF